MGEPPSARHASITSPAILTRREWSDGLPDEPERLLGAVLHRRYPVLACAGARVFVATDPVEVVTGRAVWDALGRIPLDGGGPGDGWWMGLLSYDLGTAIEMLPTPRPDPGGPPRAFLARYETVTEYSAAGVRVLSVDPAFAPERPPAAPPGTTPAADAASPAWSTSLAPRQYVQRVDAIRDLIRAGDCYQVNLTQRLVADAPGDAFAFAERLWRAARRPPLRAYLGLDEGTLVSASPERLVRVRDGVVESEPIKGTIAAGRFDQLAASAKDRAEHVMIVDLVRNDLGRLAPAGTVSVPRLMAPLHTGYVDHMVSTVRGAVAPGATAADLIWALFPGGSVTGCPKVRAMEVIHDLEPVNRGPAFGSVLVATPDGELDASILIRTAWLTGDESRYWCGGAVTWDSDPRAEHAEAMAKAAPFLEAIGA